MFLSHLRDREFHPSFVYHQMVSSVTQPRPRLWSRVEGANFWAGKGAADDYMFCSLFRLTTLACRTIWQASLLQRGFEAAESSDDSPRSIGCAAGLLLLHPPGSLVCWWIGEGAAICPVGPEIGVRNSLCLLQGDNCHFVGFGEISGHFGRSMALDIEFRPRFLAWSWPGPVSCSFSLIILQQHSFHELVLDHFSLLSPSLRHPSLNRDAGTGASQRIGVHICFWIQPNSYQAYDINYCFCRIL